MVPRQADVACGSRVRLDRIDVGAGAPRAVMTEVLPLWLDGSRAVPTLGFAGDVISSATASHCTGRWQLHLFSFGVEARQARQTLMLLSPETLCEAGARPNGEGLLLVREGPGDFACRIIDRRKTKRETALIGSWTLDERDAAQAALHVPERPAGRAALAARLLAMELDTPEEIAAFGEIFAAALPDRCVGRIRAQDVVSAANRLLEPLGIEFSCSDRQVTAAIDAHLAGARPDIDGMVDRIAHELVSELAESGCVR